MALSRRPRMLSTFMPMNRLLICIAVAHLAACTQNAGGAATPTATKPTAPDTSSVAAVINGEKLTTKELQKRIDTQSPFVRARYAEPEKRKEFLDTQVRFEVLAAEARARGYDKDPDVEDAIEKMIVQRLTREEFDSRVKQSDVTEAETQAYFEAHKADYQKPAMVRGAVLAVNNDAAGKKIIADATAALKAMQGKDDRGVFREWVMKHSIDDDTKKDGGDLRYVEQTEAARRYGDEAAQWLFVSDEQNVLSGTISHAGKLYLFRRMSLRKPINRGYDQVKNQVKNVVFREKRAAAFDGYVNGLREKFKVTTTPEVLKELNIHAVPEGAMPPADPHGHAHGGMDHMDEADEEAAKDGKG
jgi:peptidyl-prolyl cis-trans isomerase C